MKFSVFQQVERYDDSISHRQLQQELVDLTLLAERGGFETEAFIHVALREIEQKLLSRRAYRSSHVVLIGRQCDRRQNRNDNDGDHQFNQTIQPGRSQTPNHFDTLH